MIGTSIPMDAKEVLKLCTGRKDFKSLEPKLQRKCDQIKWKWLDFIYPTLLSYLSGTLNLDWKKDFFQFIIVKKYVSLTEIDWNVVLQKWPTVSKRILMQTAKDFSKNHGKRGLPLYLNIAQNLHRIRPMNLASQSKLDLIDAFEKLRNGE